MLVGSSLSTCSTANAALVRHAELLQAGASDIAVMQDGALISVSALQSLALKVAAAGSVRRG